MADIVERLRFDAARCEVGYSKGVATNIEEAALEIERLRAKLEKSRKCECGSPLSRSCSTCERLWQS